MNINKNLSSALIFVLAAGAGLPAQEMGALSGTILDPAGRPLPDVRVAISSPNMLGARVVTTNARGEYRALMLPVGNYSISTSKQGFVGSKAANVRVGLGGSVTQNFTMRPVAEAGATVNLVAEVAQADKTDTTSGVNFSAEQLASLPTINRSFEGAADFSPGLASGQGGSYSIRGGPVQSTQYRINGTDIKDEYQGARTHTGTLEDNIEDVQVVLSELHARFGRSLGGAINVVTKSGSNAYSGSVRANINRTSWEAVGRYDGFWGTTYGDDDLYSDNLSKEYHITLNGPIVKDRVWFALATRMTPTESNDYRLRNTFSGYPSPLLSINGPTSGSPDPNDPVNSILLAGPAGYTFTTLDSNSGYNQTYESHFYEGKITGMLFQDHILEFTYTKEDENMAPRNKWSDSGNPWIIGRLAALGEQGEVTQTYGFGYRGIIGSNIFVEARYNKVDAKVIWPLGDLNYGGNNERMWVIPGYPPSLGNYFGQGGNYTYPFGTGSSPNPEYRNNRSGNFNVKWIADIGDTSHELDFGLDYFEGVLDRPTTEGLGNFYTYVGGIYQNNAGVTGSSQDDYRFPAINYMGLSMYGQGAGGTVGPAPNLFQFFGQDGPNKNPAYSFYANDKFSLSSHWNGMFGVRFQNSKVNDTDGTELANDSFISPRFQLKYDLKGDGGHVFGFTAARFGTDFQVAFSTNFVKKANSQRILYGWSANPYDPYQASDPTGQYGVRFWKYEDIMNPANYQKVISFSDTSKQYRFLNDLTTPYMDEFTLSYRRQLKNGSSFSLTYANRAWKKTWAYIQEYTDGYVVEVQDPSSTGLANQYSLRTDITNSDYIERDYQSLEMEFTTRLNSFWTLGGSWTVSRLTGNDEGGDDTGQTFLDTSVTDAHLHRSLRAARGITVDDVSPYGPLNNNEPQRGRLYAQLQMPVGQGNVSMSWSLRYDAARPTSLGYNRPYSPAVDPIPFPDGQAANLTGRPTSWYYYFDQQRGQYSSNDFYRVDFKAAFAIPMGFPGWGSRVQMIGEVLVQNLFNTVQQSSIRNAFTNDCTNGQNTFRINNQPSGDDPSVTYGYGSTDIGYGNYWRAMRNINFSVGLKF